MKSTGKSEKIAIIDEMKPKEQIEKKILENISEYPKEKDDDGVYKVLNKIEPKTIENHVNIQKVPTTEISFQEDTKMEQTNKENKKKRIDIVTVNIYLTLFFSFLLVMVGIAQYKIYNRQANIAENANKLAQYQYRFEFYKKLEDIQRSVTIIKKTSQQDIEQFTDLNYKLLSLIRESELLFDLNISKDINKILGEHLDFLIEVNNNGISFDDYEKEMSKLNIQYGNFINNNNFKKYLDINSIK